LPRTPDSRLEELERGFERLREEFHTALRPDQSQRLVVAADLRAAKAERRSAELLRKLAVTEDQSRQAMHAAQQAEERARELEAQMADMEADNAWMRERLAYAVTELGPEIDIVRMKRVKLPKYMVVQLVIDTVADHFGLEPYDLERNSRIPAIVHARFTAWYILRNLTDMSLPALGQRFGGFNHSTVLNGCKRTAQLLEADLIFRHRYEDIVTQVRRTMENPPTP
jgi:chromosomal replication initiator protein